MQTINLFQAKTHLSKLIDQIASGKETEFIIARNGKPVARVVPIAPADTTRRIGIAKGEFVLKSAYRVKMVDPRKLRHNYAATSIS